MEDELVGLREREEMEKRKLRDTELELEEAQVPKTPSIIYTPSPEEYNRHCATHLPYINWCPICVQAKKHNPPHKSKRYEGEKYKYIPVISMDYMYMNEKGVLPKIAILEKAQQ